jgi:rare lipoprotein A
MSARSSLTFVLRISAALLFVTPAVARARHLSMHRHRQTTTRHNGSHRLRNAKPALVGIASWYGPHVGRFTASGEVFDSRKLTCAHRSLPFGSVIKVTNDKTGKSVIVRVNDNGPGPRGRVVDLTHAAAKAIGMNGIAKVHIDVLQEPIVEVAEAPETKIKSKSRSRH